MSKARTLLNIISEEFSVVENPKDPMFAFTSTVGALDLMRSKYVVGEIGFEGGVWKVYPYVHAGMPNNLKLKENETQKVVDAVNKWIKDNDQPIGKVDIIFGHGFEFK